MLIDASALNVKEPPPPGRALFEMVDVRFEIVGRKADYEFPGDRTCGETPVPIPNTEAKPVTADGSPYG